MPEWILKLPKPSKMKRKKMGKVSRDDTVTKDGRIGRNQARRQKSVLSVIFYSLDSLHNLHPGTWFKDQEGECSDLLKVLLLNEEMRQHLMRSRSSL